MGKRFTFAEAKQLVGLPAEFEITSRETYDYALACWKERTIEARRAGRDEAAAELSRAKELFRLRYHRRVSRVCKCGRSKSGHAEHCQICSIQERFYKNRIMESTQIKEHVIEVTPTLIPVRNVRGGEATAAMRKLALTGQVGDSFVTSKMNTTIASIGRLLGMQVICRRVNPGEKDKKKWLIRVWRSDGKSMDEVNEIIRKRLKGEAVPASAPCEPPSAEELARLRGRKPAAAE